MEKCKMCNGCPHFSEKCGCFKCPLENCNIECPTDKQCPFDEEV